LLRATVAMSPGESLFGLVTVTSAVTDPPGAAGRPGGPQGPTALAARGVMVQIRSGWTNVLDRSSVYDAARR
jgi:hypothetical protein